MSYQSDREWSDRYIPAICEIVGPRLMVAAPLQRDRDEATDLIILKAQDMTVAARVRRPGYAERYPDEFTIRDSRPSGTETEWMKIKRGFGDRFVYCHASERVEPSLAAWLLIDLQALRFFFLEHPEFLDRPGEGRGRRRNADGTTFRWFNAKIIQRYCPAVVIATHWPVQIPVQETAA